MTLSTKAKQALKAKAHPLKPVVMIGDKGLTDNVNKEIDRALTDHELIKVKVGAEDKDARRDLADAICKAQSAELVQLIGKIAVLFRKKEEA